MAQILTIPDVGSGVSVDVSSCFPFLGQSKTKHVAVSSVFETLLSITGKGFLSEAIITNSSASSNKASIKITIDGAVVLWTNSNITNSFSGLIPVTSLKRSGTTAEMFIQQPVDGYFSDIYRMISADFPLTTEQANKTLIMLTSLYFRTSLLIEILCDSSADVLKYRYQGGSY